MCPLCMLEVLEVLEAPEVMRCAQLCMLEAINCVLCMLEAAEGGLSFGVSSLELWRRVASVQPESQRGMELRRSGGALQACTRGGIEV